MLLKVVGAFFVCLWVADFVTGLAHWLEDTYCLEDYPLIGNFICEPNIEHHVDPQLMVRSGTFFSRNILQWSLCAGAYGLLWLVGLGGIYTFTILLLASFGNEIHRWNHMSKTGPFVSFMKDSGLIQVQRQHSLHHKQPHNQYYCVMTSLLNAILERINFWRKLEWVVEATTGIAPKRENRRDSLPLKKKKKAKKVAKAEKESKATDELSIAASTAVELVELTSKASATKTIKKTPIKTAAANAALKIKSTANAIPKLSQSVGKSVGGSLKKCQQAAAKSCTRKCANCKLAKLAHNT